jgi:hypothetical protein
LHFQRPISLAHTCQHYLGWCLDLDVRLAAHRAGRGARLTQVAVERGIAFEVVRTWPGDRTLERRLKNRKESPRFCPLCFPTCRRAFSIDAEQLTLPLDLCDFPTPPRLPAVWMEIATLRRWRERPAGVALADDWDDGLL